MTLTPSESQQLAYLTEAFSRNVAINEQIWERIKELDPDVSAAAELAVAAHNNDADAHAALFGTKIRERLNATLTLYVRPDGSDNNDGSANTAAGALKTLDGAWKRLRALDCAGYNVDIKFAPGGYAGGTFSMETINAPIVYLTSTDPNNKATFNSMLILADYGRIQCLGLILQGIIATRFSNVSLTNCSISTVGSDYFSFVFIAGDTVIKNGTVGIVFTAQRHSELILNGNIFFDNVTASTCTAFANVLGYIQAINVNFSGVVEGMRFRVYGQSWIDVGGKGPNAIPGTIAGIVDTNTGGIYS